MLLACWDYTWSGRNQRRVLGAYLLLNWTPFSACASLIFVIAIFLTGHSPHLQQAQAIDNVAAKTNEARSVLGQAEAAAANIKSAYERGLVLDQIGAAKVRAGDLNARWSLLVEPTRTIWLPSRRSESN